MPRRKYPSDPIPLPAKVAATARHLEIPAAVWEHIAADKMLDGRASLWVDVDVPRFGVRRSVNSSFQIDDADWTKIEEILGVSDTRSTHLEDKFFVAIAETVHGLTPTYRRKLTGILADHIRDVDAGLNIPELIKEYRQRVLKLLEVESLFAELSADPSDFLSGIFAHERYIVRNEDLHIDDETRNYLDFLWTHGVGPGALLLFVSAYRKNVERALALLPADTPTHWEHMEMGRRLALYWLDVTGERPTSGRDHETSKQTGRFGEFFRLVVKQLPEGFKWKQSQVDTQIRKATEEIKKHMGAAADAE